MPAALRIAASVALIGLAVAIAPLVARAQQPAKIPRIGLVADPVATNPFVPVFRQGLRDLGYVEGKNIRIEERYAGGMPGKFPELVAELLAMDIDVLVVGGTLAAMAAKARTSTVPIVFTLAGDPVGTGLVESLARPGGNATGLSVFHREMSVKDLEVLKAAVPNATRVAVIYNPLNPVTREALERTREAARAMGVELQAVEVRGPEYLDKAFATIMAGKPNALLVFSDPAFGTNLDALAKLAAKHRLPAIYNRREFAEAGGLLAYGPDFSDNYRRAATYVDRILKGAKPGDLPVEQPVKFELSINLKTAKALGIAIPESLMRRADHVFM
jgi:putative ABC transport system substrate-binding protein